MTEESHYAQEKKLSKEEADAHHKAMLESGRLITVTSNGEVVGFCEFFLEHGCVFVNDLFVRSGYRGSKVIWMLKERLFEVCKDAKIYIGERKKHDRQEFQLRIK